MTQMFASAVLPLFLNAVRLNESKMLGVKPNGFCVYQFIPKEFVRARIEDALSYYSEDDVVLRQPITLVEVYDYNFATSGEDIVLLLDIADYGDLEVKVNLADLCTPQNIGAMIQYIADVDEAK